MEDLPHLQDDVSFYPQRETVVDITTWSRTVASEITQFASVDFHMLGYLKANVY